MAFYCLNDWAYAVWRVTLLTPIFWILLQDGFTALKLASWNGHSEVVQQLLEAGANIDAADKVGLVARFGVRVRMSGRLLCDG